MRIIIIFFALIALTGCSIAKDGGLGRVISNYEKGDYLDSISNAERVIRTYEYDQETKAKIFYYKALSFEALNKTSDAKAIHKYIVKTFPDSESSFRSKEKLNALATN